MNAYLKRHLISSDAVNSEYGLSAAKAAYGNF